MYLERKLSLRDTLLITVYPLRMHTHTNAYRNFFISKRQPNYRDYRAPLRNKTTSRTLYLRTRNVMSSSWTERMCARDATSPTLCQYGDRFEDFACIMPLSRPQRISLQCSSDADYVNATLAQPTSRPARIRCTRKGTSFLSLFRTDVMRFRYARRCFLFVKSS